MQYFTRLLDRSSWETFIRTCRREPCLASSVATLPHVANTLLSQLRSIGVPVEFSTPPWSDSRRQRTATRGSHPSTRPYLGFLEQDMADMVRKGFWIVLPFDKVIQRADIQDLRISPMGVVPQRERRPRAIVDYSFSGVNDETVKLAPNEAMQFGRAFDRVLHAIHTAPPRHGPVYLSKIDLSDGFYRVGLRARDVPKMAVAFPTLPHEPRLVAFPLVLLMGWTESPPHFCSVTETIVDLANDYAFSDWDPPPHPMEILAASKLPRDPDNRRIDVPPPSPQSSASHVTTTPPKPNRGRAYRGRRSRRGVRYADVYMDDELLAAQGTRNQLNRFRRQVLHLNDQVLRPNTPTDLHRKQPVSEKKLRKGDATWSTRKIVLGWLIDTLRRTIELPAHRRQRLLHILQDARRRTRLLIRNCHRLLGEVRSMLMAVSGGAGLLSHLQTALQQSQGDRVRLSKATRRQLADLHRLAEDVASRPTRIAELFPATDGHYFGACDASGQGFGGVLLPAAQSSVSPMVWRLPLPASLQQQLVTFENPTGTINNSDLELAGTILHESAIAGYVPVVERTVHTMCDNTPAVAWRGKALITTTGAAAELLRIASLQQRHLRHVPRVHYIPGEANVLADAASRRFNLSHPHLLSLLARLAPHAQPWTMRRPLPQLRSAVITALRRQSPAWPLLPNVPTPLTRSGPLGGSRSFPSSASPTLSFGLSLTKSPSSVFLPSASAAAASVSVVNQSALRRYAMPCFTSRIRSPAWGPRTPA